MTTRFPRRLRAAVAFITSATLLAQTPVVLAQTVGDTSTPDAQLNIPGNVQLLGNSDPNVFRPTARVNDEIITATDVEQRLALIRLANNGQIPADQLPAVRLEIFSQLVDEILKIQEARANQITLNEADIDREFARIAAQQRLTPAQFAARLTEAGSSPASLKQQLRGDAAWQRLLGRNIDPFTQVSSEEVRILRDRLEAQRGSQEYRVGEIYLRATPDSLPQVAESARRMMEALSQGGNFVELARRNSQSSSAAQGGDLGWVRADALPPTMAQAVAGMQAGQLAGPIEVPGGISILYLIDKRQVLTADPRDATLSLKQITLTFQPGTTQARSSELAANFISRTRTIGGCGQADAVAASLGAEVISNQVVARELPAQLQPVLLGLQVGQVTPPFGNAEQGISVLVLCGRDNAQAATVPSAEDLTARLRQERVNRRAERYLRDIRRDAVITFS